MKFARMMARNLCTTIFVLGLFSSIHLTLAQDFVRGPRNISGPNNEPISDDHIFSDSKPNAELSAEPTAPSEDATPFPAVLLSSLNNEAISDQQFTSEFFFEFLLDLEEPSAEPSEEPTAEPSGDVTIIPTVLPSTAVPTFVPTGVPTEVPSAGPTVIPSSLDPTTTSTYAPTATPTAVPTIEPTTMSTLFPTAEPTPVPTPSGPSTAVPSQSQAVPWKFTTDLVAMLETNSAITENTESYCFEVLQTASVTLSTFDELCYDTRVGVAGDAYIRLRRGLTTGTEIAANDDFSWPACSDSQIVANDLAPGTYCLMMGCYGNSACSYQATIKGKPTIPGPTAEPTPVPTPSGPWPTAVPSQSQAAPWIFHTRVVAMSETNSAITENTESYCFEVLQTANVTLSTFDELCYDTRVGDAGDTYIRLRRGSTTGTEIAENDDFSWPACSDSQIVANDLAPGTYCLMMGCYGDSACSYQATIKGKPTIPGPTAEPTPVPTPTVPWPTAVPSQSQAAPWIFHTRVVAMSETNSAITENTESYCFEVLQTANVTLSTFDELCYDTRVGFGDAYIRLRRGSTTGTRLVENDDLNWPACSDSQIVANDLAPDTYCLMMGCYADVACSYQATIRGTPIVGTSSLEDIRVSNDRPILSDSAPLPLYIIAVATATAIFLLLVCASLLMVRHRRVSRVDAHVNGMRPGMMRYNDCCSLKLDEGSTCTKDWHSQDSVYNVGGIVFDSEENNFFEGVEVVVDREIR